MTTAYLARLQVFEKIFKNIDSKKLFNFNQEL